MNDEESTSRVPEPPAAGDPAADARDDRAAARDAARRERDEAYMRLALEEARRAQELGEVPIGAVVVYEPIDPATRRPLAPPQVIAQACNLRETTQDPAGHAEFLALKAAAAHLGVWRLTGCTVYVTLEPCVMCAGLMHQARIDRCVFGAPDPKAGALGSLYRVHEDARLNHNFAVDQGILADECAGLLRAFFAGKRKQKKAAPAEAAPASAPVLGTLVAPAAPVAPAPIARSADDGAQGHSQDKET